MKLSFPGLFIPGCKKYLNIYALSFIICLIFAALSTNGFAREAIVTIGTGNLIGVYYQTGKAIETLVNNSNPGIQIRVENTTGSVFNINAIMVGDLEFGIVQSDRQYQAWHGIKEWKERGSQKQLRSICSFYPETVVLLVGTDTKIKSLSDLKGKHINIGNIGAGARGNAIDLLQACSIDWRKEITVEGFRMADAAKMIQENKIDGFFHTIGHPNPLVESVTSGSRKISIVPIEGECIENLISRWPYYAKAVIPISLYPNAQNKENVPTFGVKATLCTRADISEKIVYTITKQIFDHLEEFKTFHPSNTGLTHKNMLQALSAPVHRGAVKYYREAGMSALKK